MGASCSAGSATKVKTEKPVTQTTNSGVSGSPDSQNAKDADQDPGATECGAGGPSDPQNLANSSLDTQDEAAEPLGSFQDNELPVEEAVEASPSPLEAPSVSPKVNERPTDPEFPENVQHLPLTFKKMICGYPGSHWEQEDRVIRILHIANASDSCIERKVLFEKVYPRLLHSCLEKGFELQVIDPLWGACKESSDGNLRELVNRQQRQLLKKDKALIVAAFSTDLYGRWDLPLYLTEEAYNALVTESSEAHVSTLNHCYTRVADNDGHMLYRLRPRSTRYNAHNGQQGRHEDLDAIQTFFNENTSEEFKEKYLLSDYDQSLQDIVFNKDLRSENLVCINRTFKNTEGISKHSSAKYYFNLSEDGEEDPIATMKLQNMLNRLNGKVDPNNEINHSVSWQEDGIQATSGAYAQYLDRLCSDYEYLVGDMVDKVLNEKRVYKTRMIYYMSKGISSRLYEEMHRHHCLCEELTSRMVPVASCWDDLVRYVTQGHLKADSEDDADPCPLLIKGKVGCGKSSLVARLAKQLQDLEGMHNAVCLLRFVGGSVECETEEQLLASVCEHLCLFTELHLSQAYEVVRTGDLCKLLEVIPSDTKFVLIIDGLDQLQGRPTLSWLKNKYPRNVRMVVTMADQPENLANTKVITDTLDSVEIPTLTTEETQAVADAAIAETYPNIDQDNIEVVQEILTKLKNPLHIRLAATCLALEGLDGSPNSGGVLLDMRDQVAYLFELLQESLEVEWLPYILQLLVLARHGLSDIELNDLLACGKDLPSNLCCSNKINEGTVPQYIWTAIKEMLSAYLSKRSSTGTILYKLQNSIFRETISEMYSNAQHQARAAMTDYFEHKARSKSQYTEEDDGLLIARQGVFKEQALRYGSHVNRRRLDEHPWCLIQNNNFDTFESKYIKSTSMLCCKLEACGVFQLIFDIESMNNSPDSADIDKQYAHDLLEIFFTNLEVLSPNPGVFSQVIHQRYDQYEKSDKLTKCLKMLHENLQCNNVPVIKPSILEETQSNVDHERHSMTAVETIKDHPGFVVTVLPGKGEAVVWNIAQQKPVRTLTGLIEPKMVKILTGTKAILLCARELIIYDLDNGEMLCKLKGLLNLKMPYFDIQDQDHIIALSRNRMCVNLINAKTGDIVAAFKAGEDRFMDSLLVSSNGQKCVCGDEAQKPFPLLVWDLTQRKLCHDIRIQGHEFVTSMASISDDGHFVVTVCRAAPHNEDAGIPEPNFLVVYDLTSRSLYMKWKPDYNTTSVALSSQSSVVVSGQEDGRLFVWDLIGGALKHSFSGHSRGVDRIRFSADGVRAVTYDSSARDTVVFLWDVVKGVHLGSYVTSLGATCCVISLDGASVVICQPNSDHILTLYPQPDETTSEKEAAVFGDSSHEGQIFNCSPDT